LQDLTHEGGRLAVALGNIDIAEPERGNAVGRVGVVAPHVPPPRFGWVGGQTVEFDD
jgi:hypothetical protein